MTIRQSTPSKTELEISLTSALVGVWLSIIDSRSCVAITTGLPILLANPIISFCAAGTFPEGISTPRSPLATIRPSNASVIFTKSSNASHFSIFAITGRRTLKLSMISCTPSISEAFLTNESAIQSDSSFRANFKSSLSWSVSAGTPKDTPGKLTPLPFCISPPIRVLQRKELSSMTSSTSSCTLPSLIKIFDPVITLDSDIELVTNISPEPSLFEITTESPS